MHDVVHNNTIFHFPSYKTHSGSQSVDYKGVFSQPADHSVMSINIRYLIRRQSVEKEQFLQLWQSAFFTLKGSYNSVEELLYSTTASCTLSDSARTHWCTRLTNRARVWHSHPLQPWHRLAFGRCCGISHLFWYPGTTTEELNDVLWARQRCCSRHAELQKWYSLLTCSALLRRWMAPAWLWR